MFTLRASSRLAVAVPLAAVVLSLSPEAPASTSCSGPFTLDCQTAVPSSVSPASVPHAHQRYGFNDNTWWNPQFPRSVYLSKLHQSGATLLRTGINWQSYEPRYKHYRKHAWADYDREYRHLLAAGVREDIMLIGTPYWALTPQGRGATYGDFRCDNTGGQCVAPPNIRDPRVRKEWQHFVRKVVARYPRAAAIEVWNEPNIRPFWLQKQNPKLYAHLVRATAQAVRQVSKKMPILAGSTANYFGRSTPWETDAIEFVRDVYRWAGATKFTAISWHFYVCNAPGVLTEASQKIHALRRVRRAMGGSQPIWLTETGATSSGGLDANCGGGPYTESGQAGALTRMLNWAKRQQARHHDFPVAIVHTLADPESRQSIYFPNTDAEGEYGLVAYSHTALTKRTVVANKPAFAAVRCEFGGGC